MGCFVGCRCCFVLLASALWCAVDNVGVCLVVTFVVLLRLLLIFSVGLRIAWFWRKLLFSSVFVWLLIASLWVVNSVG